MPDLTTRARGRQKKIEMGTRALAALDDWISRNALESSLAAPPIATDGAPSIVEVS
jgi:hypothetical protein